MFKTPDVQEAKVVAGPSFLAAGLRRSLVSFALVRPRVDRSVTRVAKAHQTLDATHVTVRRSNKYFLSFIFLVIVPALLCGLYFACIAADQYSAEVRFAVTSPHNDSGDKFEKIKASLSTGVTGVANQDAYMIAAYIRSRAIIDDLSKTINLREVFRRPEADFLARLDAKASSEKLAEYWRSMVTAYVDSMSGIVTVTVRAFRREDALAIATAVLKASEDLANTVSARARQDTMKLAETEVARTEKRVLGSLADLQDFRQKVGFIDPSSQAKDTSELLKDLLADKIKLQSEYFVSTHAMSPDAPTVQAMKSRLDYMDKQIGDERAKLTGASAENPSLASALPKYEELELQNRFSEKIYSFAQDGLERARLRAEAQTIYVEAFVPPTLPEEAEYPKRFWMSVATLGVLIVLWGIGAMAFAVVEDHRV